MSKKFTAAQHVYATYERETLAILEALLKFEDRLLGCKFKVITDHETLTFLKTQKKLSYRQLRWVEYLDCFDMVIEAVEGATNKVADALSRYYASDTPDDHHRDYKYVNADIRLNKDLEDLARDQVEELQQLMAVYVEEDSDQLKECQEDHHKEADELAGKEYEPMICEDKYMVPVYKAQAWKQLTHVEEDNGFIKAVVANYANDPLFCKIVAKPLEYKGFWIEDEQLFTKNRAGDAVLCVPKGSYNDRKL
jgi:hypothetical protein